MRDLADAVRARLTAWCRPLLQASAALGATDAAWRAMALLHNILRRSSYLALLDERPTALSRLVDVVARSSLLAERITAHPLLLDELLDARLSGPLPQREALRAECEAAMSAAGGDDRAGPALPLNEKRHALGFRIALATLDNRQAAAESAPAGLAGRCGGRLRAAARADRSRTRARHARGAFAVLGYGSLGGGNSASVPTSTWCSCSTPMRAAQSDLPPRAGARALDAPRWCAASRRRSSRCWTPTAGGRLYDIDVRLRPDGAKGPAGVEPGQFLQYQRERAWTWEHQALVRARCVAGDASLGEAFESVRAETLSKPRDAGRLADEVSSMRARMHAELDRSDAARFDLKAGGEGGLVDLSSCCSSSCCAMPARIRNRSRRLDTPACCALGDAGVLPDAGALRGRMPPARRRPALHAGPAQAPAAVGGSPGSGALRDLGGGARGRAGVRPE